MKLLRDNLQEIYAAAHSTHQFSCDLVPNLSGTHVYYTGSGWGRVWKLIYCIIDLFAGESFRLQKLAQAIKKTEQTFKKLLPEILENVEKYTTYLEKKSLGIEVDEEDVHPIRRKITAWNLATEPFVRSYIEDKNPVMSKLFKQFFPDDAKKIFPPLIAAQQLIDLEGYLHRPLPLELFKKLANRSRLKKKEMSSIQKWVDLQSKKRSPLSVRPFHLALKAFVERLKTLPHGGNPDLVSLELALNSLGLKIFQTKDPIHLKWRLELKSGDVLQLGETTLTLGKKIGAKKEGEDNNLIFTIKDDPDHVIIVGINQAILPLKNRVDQLKGWGIMSAHCVEIEPYGAFGVYERLWESLEDIEWCSKESLDKKDDDILLPVCNMLKWMVQRHLSPLKLLPRHLKFDKNGTLKYGKICLPGEFNYTLLEDFAYRLAKDNLIIFSRLMEGSGLFAHRYRKFFEKMVDSALKDLDKDPSTIAAIENITDPRIVDRGEILASEISKLVEDCRKSILSRYRVTDVDQLETRIKEEILLFYNQSKLSGLLVKGMQKEVEKRVVTSASLQLIDTW